MWGSDGPKKETIVKGRRKRRVSELLHVSNVGSKHPTEKSSYPSLGVGGVKGGERTKCPPALSSLGCLVVG